MVRCGVVPQVSHRPQRADLMRRTGILTGGIGSLLPLAAVCRSHSHPSSTPPRFGTPTTFHANMEQGGRRFCGVWLTEGCEVTPGDQGYMFADHASVILADHGLDGGPWFNYYRRAFACDKSVWVPNYCEYSDVSRTLAAPYRTEEAVLVQMISVVISRTAGSFAAVLTTSTH